LTHKGDKVKTLSPNFKKPLKFKTPESLLKVIEEYFETTPFELWTVTGLALVVGSKQLLNDYEKRPGYSNIVTRAKLKIENSYESSLRTTGGSNNIFALKNFGWTDQQDLKHSSEINTGGVLLVPSVGSMSDWQKLVDGKRD
jgi:hypothetical protein